MAKIVRFIIVAGFMLLVLVNFHQLERIMETDRKLQDHFQRIQANLPLVEQAVGQAPLELFR